MSKKTLKKSALITVTIFCLCILSFPSHAQVSNTYLDFEATEFKSVFINNPPSSNINIPLLELGSDQRLSIHFDDVQDRDLNLRYRIIHCNLDSKLSSSSINELEYIEGQNQFYIEESELSMATRINYVHYSFSVPNRYQRLKISGIYKAEVFEADNPDIVLLSVPFLVYEPSVKIKASVNIPKRVDYRFTKQEISVELNLSSSKLNIISPQQNIKLFVQQNLNPKTAKELTLQYSANNIIYYKDSPDMLFDGLNEFRNFDIRPLTYEGRGVERLELDPKDQWHVFLFNESSKNVGSSYMDNNDINGDFVIKKNHSDISNIEADYAYVHFFLKTPFKPDTKIYVTGSFNRWKTDNKSLMSYDHNLNLYTLTSLCKQGFYDYIFLLSNNKSIDYISLEGNFQETENDYFFFVFYREPGGRYDRLVGVERINTRVQ